jgi:membrane peptidoglycan carboxypeptidase
VTRLARLVAIVAASALLIAGAVTGATMIVVGLVKHTATAKALPLPALTSSAAGGSTVYADDGTTVLGVLQASQDRKPIPLSEVSKTLITAVLDTEDHNFYIHGGFDIPSLLRAAAADSTTSGGLQGGSTIAQQLVKQTYLTSQRTLSRKIKEAILAVRLEQQYTKNQILQAYLNTIYLGSSAYGVEAASNVYFNEHASQLTVPQAALLAGLIQNPSGYDPIIHPAAARDRRSEVLSRMVHYHDITPAQAAAANATPLPTASFLVPPPATDTISNYYVNEVKNELLSPGSPLGGTFDQRWQALFDGGLKIYTNFDPTMQAEAEQTVAADTPPNNRGFEQALVSIDPTSGKVRALVGGAGTGQSQFDIITQGTRQPGSGFKLFTLLAALNQGYSVYDTVLGRSPCAINFPGDPYYALHPAHNDAQAGVINLVTATADSVNCAYLRLAHEVGLQNIADMAKSMGVGSSPGDQLPVFPSMVLGADVVHPIEMAAAYATVADGGVYHAPTFIDHIVDRSGSVIYTGASPPRQVFSPQVAAEATVALQAVVQYGTATEAALYNRPVAGKTGTTENSVDAWFNGFTPQMETTVWMGNLQAEVPMYGVIGVGEVYGGTVPAHTWHDYMAQVLAGSPVVPFMPPNPRLLPAPKFITSPSLVRDDVLDHNGGYLPPPPTSFYAPPPTSVGFPPPSSPATTSPPTTSPPVTLPPRKKKP